jgi:transposase
MIQAPSGSLAAHDVGRKARREHGNEEEHTPEQVVRKLGTADRMLGDGQDVADVCRELQVSEQTYYRWRNQFGGLKADDAKRLKDLERENATLKRLLADAELEKAALKEIARGNF